MACAERALAAAISAGPYGLAARAGLAQAGLALGTGLRDYLRLVRGAAPSAPPAGRSALYQRLWQQAALQVGAECHDLGGGLLHLTRDGRSTMVWDSLVPLDDPVVQRLAVDKPAARSRLRSAGLPVPEQVVCGGTDLATAHDMLDRSHQVVVKPAASGGGLGVTCGVRTAKELVFAFAFALRSSDRVVVEQRISGDEHRLLVLGDRVVGAVRRRPPSVTGDGRTTVRGLIDRVNEARRTDPWGSGLYPVSFDLDLALTLRRTGWRLDAVPEAGVQVLVKTAVNENGPEDNLVVAPPPALGRTAAAAAAALGASLAAVEIISPDPDRPPEDVGGAVVEVNTTPGLHYHYGGAAPLGSQGVAAQVLEHLLSHAAPAPVPLALHE